MAEPRFDVTSLGEMLLRLSVPSGQRIENASHLDVHPAGAEANVMSLLARLERKSYWVGALPQNSLGRLAANALRTAGANTEGIIWNEVDGWGHIMLSLARRLEAFKLLMIVLIRACLN